MMGNIFLGTLVYLGIGLLVAVFLVRKIAFPSTDSMYGALWLLWPIWVALWCLGCGYGFLCGIVKILGEGKNE